MKKRTEEKGLQTFEDLDGVMKMMAIEQTALDALDAKMQKEIIAVKDKYEARIREKQSAIKNLEKEVAGFMKKKKSLFKEIRTKVLTYGSVGFRLGNRKLVKISKKDNDETITEKFFNIFSDRYVKVKKTLDKAGILTAAEKNQLTAEQLETCGVKVVRKDEAWFKINTDAIKENDEDAK